MTTQDPRLDAARDKGHECAQYIRELYEAGVKLWSKESFLRLETQLRDNPTLKSFMVTDIDGVARERLNPLANGPSDDESESQLVILFKNYQDLVYYAETLGYLSMDETELCQNLDSYLNYWKESVFESYGVGYSYGGSIGRTNTTNLRDSWAKAQDIWLRSPGCTELEAIFSTSYNFPNATKIICLGLGSLEHPVSGLDLDQEISSDGQARRAAMTQHAVALTVAKLLGERQGSPPLPIIAQDPAYTVAEKQLLAELGIAVIEGFGSLAFTLIDDEAVVFSCRPNIPVKQIVADIARPAAMIWDRVVAEESENSQWRIEVQEDGTECRISPWTTDEDSPRTRQLVKGYTENVLAEENDRLHGLAIYIRKD